MEVNTAPFNTNYVFASYSRCVSRSQLYGRLSVSRTYPMSSQIRDTENDLTVLYQFFLQKLLTCAVNRLNRLR